MPPSTCARSSPLWTFRCHQWAPFFMAPGPANPAPGFGSRRSGGGEVMSWYLVGSNVAGWWYVDSEMVGNFWLKLKLEVGWQSETGHLVIVCWMSPVAVQTAPKMPWQYRCPTLLNAMFNMVFVYLCITRHFVINMWFRHQSHFLTIQAKFLWNMGRSTSQSNSLNCFIERALQKTWSDNVKHIFQKYDAQPRSHTIWQLRSLTATHRERLLYCFTMPLRCQGCHNGSECGHCHLCRLVRTLVLWLYPPAMIAMASGEIPQI